MLRQRSTRLTVKTTTALTLMGLNMTTTWSWEALLFFRTWHLEPMTRASARGAQVRLLFYVFRVVGGGETLSDDLVGREIMATEVVAAPAVDSGLDRAFCPIIVILARSICRHTLPNSWDAVDVMWAKRRHLPPDGVNFRMARYSIWTALRWTVALKVLPQCDTR